ncbi:MAG: hypothetical protein ABR981_04000 [Candidatus Micrarchaeaceae archaeon]|jgi:hypothetical protein
MNKMRLATVSVTALLAVSMMRAQESKANAQTAEIKVDNCTVYPGKIIPDMPIKRYVAFDCDGKHYVAFNDSVARQEGEPSTSIQEREGSNTTDLNSDQVTEILKKGGLRKVISAESSKPKTQ